MKPFPKFTFVVIFGVYVGLTVNPMKIQLANQVDRYPLTVVTADSIEDQATYEKYQEVGSKYRVVAASSGTLALLSA